MFYSPKEYPTKSFISITLIVLIGILGSVYVHPLFLIAALLYWMQYTSVLSFSQFKNKSTHKINSLTGLFLQSIVRFVVFEMLAVIGILFYLLADNVTFGIFALLVWWLFAVNFYFYYTKKYWVMIILGIIVFVTLFLTNSDNIIVEILNFFFITVPLLKFYNFIFSIMIAIFVYFLIIRFINKKTTSAGSLFFILLFISLGIGAFIEIIIYEFYFYSLYPNLVNYVASQIIGLISIFSGSLIGSIIVVSLLFKKRK